MRRAYLERCLFFAMLGMVALAAYLQARGLSALLGTSLLEGAATENRAHGGEAGPELSERALAGWAPRRSRSALPIIERNPFDSVTGSLLPGAEALAEEARPIDPLSAPACDGVFVYTVTESTDPRWSMAVVQASGAPRGLVRRVGDQVGDYRVAYIGYNPVERSPSVWLLGEGALCQSVLFSETPRQRVKKAKRPKAQAKQRKKPKERRRKATPKLPSALAKKIDKIGANEYQIERSAIDTILGDYAKLMRRVRMRPVQKDGKLVGMRISRIQSGTLLSELGLKNGDRIDSINGFPLTSPEKALTAYARLRTASNISVKVQRGGKPVTIDYRIR